ncbi:hypothetical protein MMC08_001988 [Hypocenomyce scalaris]|nr:hypothetical protein [Hypocenomyce scalaris]
MQRHRIPAKIFFDISRDLYSQIPESDSVWRDYFTMEAGKHIVGMDTNTLLEIMGKALLANSMAMDVFKAQCKVMDGFKQTTDTAIATATNALSSTTDTPSQLPSMLELNHDGIGGILLVSDISPLFGSIKYRVLFIRWVERSRVTHISFMITSSTGDGR